MNADWRRLALEVSTRARALQVLRERGQDVLIARVALPGGSAVVKLWNRPTLRGALRRLTRTNPGAREWRTLRRLRAAGLAVPEPYAYLRLTAPPARHTEALIVQDLGACRDTTEELKALLRTGDEPAVRRFEDEILAATRVLVDCGLLDHDHRLPNFVTTPEGRPVRLDFELVRRVPFPRRHPRRLGIMLGTLLGSYAFAVQPDTARTRDFAARLAAVVQPPAAALRVARARALAMLDRQKREIGLATPLDLPW